MKHAISVCSTSLVCSPWPYPLDDAILLKCCQSTAVALKRCDAGTRDKALETTQNASQIGKTQKLILLAALTDSYRE